MNCVVEGVGLGVEVVSVLQIQFSYIYTHKPNYFNVVCLCSVEVEKE